MASTDVAVKIEFPQHRLTLDHIARCQRIWIGLCTFHDSIPMQSYFRVIYRIWSERRYRYGLGKQRSCKENWWISLSHVSVLVISDVVLGLLQKKAVLVKNPSTASAYSEFACSKILSQGNIWNLFRVTSINHKKCFVLNRFSCYSVTLPPKNMKTFTNFVCCSSSIFKTSVKPKF